MPGGLPRPAVKNLQAKIDGIIQIDIGNTDGSEDGIRQFANLVQFKGGGIPVRCTRQRVKDIRPDGGGGIKQAASGRAIFGVPPGNT